MLMRKIIAVYPENHTKHINIHVEQKHGFLNVQAGGTNSDYFTELKRFQNTGIRS
jgi:hypothetical protein